MKYLFIGIALSFLIMPALLKAQDHKWEVGVNIFTARNVVHFKGLGINPIIEDILIPFNKDRDSSRISVSGGIKAWYHFSKYFSVGTAMQFLSRGNALIFASIYWPAPPPNAKMVFLSPIPHPEYYRQVSRIYYFSIPLLAKVSLPVKKYAINLEAGPSIDFFWREYDKSWVWGKYGEYDEGVDNAHTNWDKHNYSLYAGLSLSREFAKKYKAEAGIQMNYGTSMATKMTVASQYPRSVGLNLGLSRLF